LHLRLFPFERGRDDEENQQDSQYIDQRDNDDRGRASLANCKFHRCRSSVTPSAQFPVSRAPPASPSAWEPASWLAHRRAGRGNTLKADPSPAIPFPLTGPPLSSKNKQTRSNLQRRFP